MKSIRTHPLIWLNLLLAPVAVASLYFALRNAFILGHSHDLQWSGLMLLAQRLDPYHQFLLHDPQYLLHPTQVPNYLHELYILLYPLGLLRYAAANLVWVVVNCLFSAAIVVLLARLYRLGRAQALLLASLMVAGTSFRLSVSAGTQTLLELLLFCLVFSTTIGSATSTSATSDDDPRTLSRGLALGLSYCKYSFSPVLFFYFALQRRFRLLAISFIPPVAGLLLMAWIVRGNLLTLAAEPLMVSRVGVYDGMGDLMSIVRSLGASHLPPAQTDRLAYLAALLASIAIAWLVARKALSPQTTAAALAVACLMLFVHVINDYVFLVVPLAACLVRPLSAAKATVIALIAILWYAPRFLSGTASVPFSLLVSQLLVFSALAVILILTLTASTPTSSEPSQP